MQKRIITLLILTALIIQPISAQVVPRDFLAEVGKGNVPGHRLVPVRSHSHVIGAAEQIIWCLTVDYVFPPAATLMNVSSTDVDDVGGDTGAWNITVFGLDADWMEQQEIIQLNGQNPVSTVNQYIRINGLHGRDAGTTESNEGDIHIGVGATVAGVPATTYNLICADRGNSLTGLYTVPVNHTAFMVHGLFGTADNKVVEFIIRIRGNIPGENRMWKNVQHFHVDQQFVALEPRYGQLPIRADLMLRSEAAGADTRVNFGMILLLIDDDVLHNSTLNWEDGEPSRLDVNIVESIDLMTAEFIAFIALAFTIMYIAWITEDNRNSALWYAFSTLFWIATMYQWAVDQVGTASFSLIWLFTALMTFCILQFLEKNWGVYDDVERIIRKERKSR